MQRNQRATHRMTSLAQADELLSIEKANSRKRRRLAIAVVTIGLGVVSGWSAIVIADQPEPLNRLGRFTGRGYSDGYHACQTSGQRLRADLPPTSYSHRGGLPQHQLTSGHGQPASGFATYYYKFDHACGSSQACGSAGIPGHAFVQPHVLPGQFYLPESQSILVPDHSGSSPQIPERSEPVSSMTPNAIRLPNPMNPLPTFDPVAEAQREREERDRELIEQRRMLAEQERYRQFQVFEKLRLREQADKLHLDEQQDDKRQDDELLSVEPESGPQSLPNTEDASPAERNGSDEAELSSPDSSDLLARGLSRPSRMRVSPDALTAPMLVVESSPLAQSYLHHLKALSQPLSQALPSSAPSTTSVSPQVSRQGAYSTTLGPTTLGPIKLPESGSSAFLLTPPSGHTVSEPTTVKAEPSYTSQNATAQNARNLIVQPTDDVSFDSAQEPEHRIALGDWLIIRQPQ